MAERLAFLRGGHAEEALLVGWICLLAHSLFVPVLPLVPALGYLVAVARATIDDESALPPVDLRALVSDGAAASAVCLGYGLVPLAVGAVTVSLASGTAVDPTGGASPLFLLGSTTTLFVVLAGLYALPIALCASARGGIRAALPGRPFLRVAGHAAYFVGWTGGVVLFALGVAAGGVVERLPVAGPVLAPLVRWVVVLAATRRLAAAYRAAR
ncbi:DUF4013 domain-containing protein [Halalkalicoccus sp. NIPERK01]|uniref:DUF4013 domain-containing protein n=1 Tax=Halalkalicoccus sp. NIPERK01 TaxID=3053469 RepID=UPI00256F2A84|nr:DUF4013 domain-containing protein [Halalkalicoccus sp. NIPERK01]MDL5361290.1 DUF4013 domain-containing protein [Halalkalicoccus sp. NIPERK01]